MDNAVALAAICLAGTTVMYLMADFRARTITAGHEIQLSSEKIRDIYV